MNEEGKLEMFEDVAPVVKKLRELYRKDLKQGHNNKVMLAYLNAFDGVALMMYDIAARFPTKVGTIIEIQKAVTKVYADVTKGGKEDGSSRARSNHAKLSE